MTDMTGDETEDVQYDEESTEGSDDSEGSTHGTDKRYWLTNDSLAVTLTSSLIAIIVMDGAGRLTLETVPQAVLYVYVGAVGASIAWAFGADAVEAWRGGKE